MTKFERATLFRVGAFGTTKLEARDVEITFRKSAQYPSSVYVSFVERGKRKRMAFAQDYEPNLTVYAGWGHELPVPPTMEKTDGGEKTRFATYDPRWRQEYDVAIEAFAKQTGRRPDLDFRNHDTRSPAPQDPEASGAPPGPPTPPA